MTPQTDTNSQATDPSTPAADGRVGGTHTRVRLRRPSLWLLPDRRDEVRQGPKTMLVLDGQPASGRTTLTRYIARTYGLAPVDADAARRAIAVDAMWFCYQNHEPGCWHETPDRDERWAQNVSTASLVCELLAVEIMDQGRDTVVCGLVDAYADGEPSAGWAAALRQLIDPHRMFGVLLTVEEPIRQERLARRGTGWCSPPDTTFQGRPGWADLVVDTSTCSVADAATIIMSALHEARTGEGDTQ